MHYVPSGFKDLYEALTSWPTAEREECPEQDLSDLWKNEYIEFVCIEFPHIVFQILGKIYTYLIIPPLYALK